MVSCTATPNIQGRKKKHWYSIWPTIWKNSNTWGITSSFIAAFSSVALHSGTKNSGKTGDSIYGCPQAKPTLLAYILLTFWSLLMLLGSKGEASVLCLCSSHFSKVMKWAFFMKHNLIFWTGLGWSWAVYSSCISCTFYNNFK